MIKINYVDPRSGYLLVDFEKMEYKFENWTVNGCNLLKILDNQFLWKNPKVHSSWISMENNYDKLFQCALLSEYKKWLISKALKEKLK